MIAAVAVPAMSVLVRHLDLGLFSAEPAAVWSEKESILPETTYAAAEIIAGDVIEYEPPAVEQHVPAATVTAEKTEIPWRLIAAWAWIAASLILAVRLLVTFVRGTGLLRRATPLDQASLQEAARVAKRNLGINQEVNVLSSDSICSPIIWCWAKRPALLVPQDAVQADDQIHWVSVLCHELAHYKRRDHLSGLLAELAVCILPWNPLLWWAKSRLVWLSEQACDDWVVASGESGADYARSLLDLVPQGQLALVPTVAASKKELKTRVSRLLQDRCGNPRSGGWWAVLVTVIAACVALGTALAQERRADREPPRQEPAAPAYRPEREVSREPGPEQREAERAELTQHRRELLGQISGIERELRALRDDQDVEARELQAKLGTLREEIARLDAQLGGPEREREMRSRELLGQREALQKRLGELELALERLPDGREAEGREIRAELEKIREQMRRVEDQLRDAQLPRREREERQPPEADARVRELMEHREELQKKARDIERRLAERPDSPDARELQAELQKIREQIQRINQELAELQRPPRERPEPERPKVGPLVRQLTEHREQLQIKARDIERRLAERPDSPDARELQAELQKIREQMQRINQELAELQRPPRERPEPERERPEQARLEELKRAINRALEQGRHDEAERLEREAAEIMLRLEERPDRRPEPRPEGLQREVQQLRDEVMQLRREMQQMRELIQQLLQRQRPERERIPERQRRPEAERREREPRPEGEQIGVEGPRF
jgi:beta-lactamase regulating signal transducer with metallopeptidase domain